MASSTTLDMTKLLSLPAALQRGASVGVGVTLQAIQTDAQSLVAVDTGTLQQSIQITIDPPDELSGSVWTDVVYAAAQEFGDPTKPNYTYTPYLGPAAELNRNAFPVNVADGIKADL